MKRVISRKIAWVAAAAASLGACGASVAQQDMPSKVPVAWNRYYTHGEINGAMRDITAAYPELVTLTTIATTLQGRDLVVATVTSPKNGPDTEKPAMWIDGNVHGNEVQAAEVVLYTLWYLTKAYGRNETLTSLLDEYTFYLLPVANPDGRDYWLAEANTPHSSRHNHRPLDNDLDGLIDEDPPEDLDGDGHITAMWRENPDGDWTRDAIDPRIFKRLSAEDREKAPEGVARYELLGQEGIDNDGDGRTNEDGPFADDMNRNWPSEWQPNYVQFGAGPYPFSAPEARGIGMFILDRPNIAAGQSYHNAGGMILRGPGASYRENTYPAPDRRVYDEIAGVGEQMLPYYRSMVIYRDLYTVHGGFVNWLSEGLGVFAFTNELWTAGKYFQRDVDSPSDEQDWLWRDRMAFGQLFTPYTEVEHPEHGTVLIGGLNKWSSRNTPTFMLEEECHRNFAFTTFHAGQMPLLRYGRTEVKRLGDRTWSVTTEVRNSRLIPTRSAWQRFQNIGRNDLLLCEPPAGGDVVAAGTLRSWNAKEMDEVRHEPARVQVSEGIAGRSGRIFRFVVTGDEGSAVTLRYDAERARNIETTIELRESE